MPVNAEESAAGAKVNGSAPEPAASSRVIHNNRGSYGEVLAHKHYRNVLIAQFVSNVGTWMEAFAIQMFVATATGRLDDQGTLGALGGLPIFALGLFGGVVADRANKRMMLVVTQVLAGLVAIGVAIVSAMHFENPRHAIYILFGLSFVNGVVMAFNFPAWQVLTPRLVPRDLLTRAIALNGIQFNLARVIGPAAAGALLAQFSSTPLFIFNAISFFLVAIVVMTTPNSPANPPSGVPVWKQIQGAWDFVWRGRGPFAVFLAQVYISLLAAPLVRMLSLFVIDVYGLETKKAETAAGLLLAIQGVGAVTGGLCLRLIPSWYPKHHFIPMSVAALGLSICMFALTTNLWVGYAAMLVVGFFWIWSFNQSWAAMQVLAPDAMRGKVLALTTTASFGATAVGVYLAGLLGETLKTNQILTAAVATQTVIGVLGVPLLVGGLYMLLNRTPEVDGMPRVPADQRGRQSLVRAILASEHRPKAGANDESAAEAETHATRGS